MRAEGRRRRSSSSATPRPVEGAAGRGVDGDRVAAEGLLDHGGQDVVGRERLVLLERLERLLERLLGQRLEVEAVGLLEELAEEPADPLGPPLGVGQAGQDALDLLERADADLVPVEELVLEPREGLVGLLAGRLLVADPVDDRLEDREPASPRSGLGL